MSFIDHVRFSTSDPGCEPRPHQRGEPGLRPAARPGAGAGPSPRLPQRTGPVLALQQQNAQLLNAVQILVSSADNAIVVNCQYISRRKKYHFMVV